MNLEEYAQKYIARYRLNDPKHGPYEGVLADEVMQVMDMIQSQHHSGDSLMLFVEMVTAIFKGYILADTEDPIWKEFFKQKS